MSNQVALAIGDVVSLDGGDYIVEQTGIRATCRQLNPKPGQKPQTKVICPSLPRMMIVESRGEAGIRAARQAKAAQRHLAGEIALEPGDALCYQCCLCCVTEVTEKTATICSRDGQVWTEKRYLNEFLLSDCSCGKHPARRLTEPERAENLKTFLATRQPQRSEAVAGGETNNMETNKETVMAKKTKATKAAKQPKVAKVKSTQPEIFGFRVRSVIRRLGNEGATGDQVALILAAKKIEVPSGAIPNEIKHGNTGKGALAELTKEQVKELMAIAKG